MSEDLGSRLRAVVAATFGVPAASITEQAGAHSIETWDSMNHIHLIVALEAEFGVSFEPERAIELVTVASIEQALKALGAS
jgi:acyl carrier protein